MGKGLRDQAKDRLRQYAHEVNACGQISGKHPLARVRDQAMTDRQYRQPRGTPVYSEPDAMGRRRFMGRMKDVVHAVETRAAPRESTLWAIPQSAQARATGRLLAAVAWVDPKYAVALCWWAHAAWLGHPDNGTAAWWMDTSRKTFERYFEAGLALMVAELRGWTPAKPDIREREPSGAIVDEVSTFTPEQRARFLELGKRRPLRDVGALKLALWGEG